jgi:uncharacterized protein YndB with AHSA1/START domain
MSTASTTPDINGKVTVAVPVERAFEVFTANFGTWWPAAYHIGTADMADVIMEARAGGRWYERGVDGNECDWGRVVAWEPPHRLVLTWQINGEWQFDPDPEHASEVEVRFTADGPEQTTVTLEHRNIDRITGGEMIYGAIRGGGGWSAILADFAATVAKHQ